MPNLLQNNAPVDHNELITERKIGVYQNRKRFSWTKPTPLQKDHHLVNPFLPWCDKSATFAQKCLYWAL